jgi:hypothetical protein
VVIGINWTGIAEDVPALEDYRKALKLPKTIRVPGGAMRLQGLCDSERELGVMLRQADNGRRGLVARSVMVGTATGKRTFFAVYVR